MPPKNLVQKIKIFPGKFQNKEIELFVVNSAGNCGLHRLDYLGQTHGMGADENCHFGLQAILSLGGFGEWIFCGGDEKK